MRVAINGFGRIGRSVFRILNAREDIDVVAINDLFDPNVLAYLLKYDTVMKGFGQEVRLEGDILKTPYEEVKMLAIKDPTQLPWKEMNIDVGGMSYAEIEDAAASFVSLSFVFERRGVGAPVVLKVRELV